jgi:hypothetical protein
MCYHRDMHQLAHMHPRVTQAWYAEALYIVLRSQWLPMHAIHHTTYTRYTIHILVLVTV